MLALYLRTPDHLTQARALAPGAVEYLDDPGDADRPERDRMLADLRAGAIARVVTRRAADLGLEVLEVLLERGFEVAELEPGEDWREIVGMARAVERRARA